MTCLRNQILMLRQAGRLGPPGGYGGGGGDCSHGGGFMEPPPAEMKQCDEYRGDSCGFFLSNLPPDVTSNVFGGWKDQEEKSIQGPMAIEYKDIILTIVETIKEMLVLLMKILLQNVLQGDSTILSFHRTNCLFSGYAAKFHFIVLLDCSRI